MSRSNWIWIRLIFERRKSSACCGSTKQRYHIRFGRRWRDKGTALNGNGCAPQATHPWRPHLPLILHAWNAWTYLHLARQFQRSSISLLHTPHLFTLYHIRDHLFVVSGGIESLFVHHTRSTNTIIQSLLLILQNKHQRRVDSVSSVNPNHSTSKLAAAFIHRPMAIDIQAPAPRTLPSLQSTPSSEERPSLPSLGFDISRPSSTSTQASSHYSQFRHGSNPTPTIQLPGLSTLASLASIASTTPLSENNFNNGYVSFERMEKPMASRRC